MHKIEDIVDCELARVVYSIIVLIRRARIGMCTLTVAKAHHCALLAMQALALGVSFATMRLVPSELKTPLKQYTSGPVNVECTLRAMQIGPYRSIMPIQRMHFDFMLELR